MSESNQADIVNVVDSNWGEHRLYTVYDEGDPLAGAGAITLAQSSKNSSFLKANYQLNGMWASHEGNLWTIDDVGNVYSTFLKLNTEKPAHKNLRYGSDLDVEWRVSQIFWGQLNGIWGTSDTDVWVTSFAGPGFHWDGRYWNEFELAEAPTAIQGVRSDDIYIVGYHGAIQHWDGSIWTKVALPSNVRKNEPFTDVCVVDSDTVYITGRGGVLLVGNAKSGFNNISTSEYSWYGVEEFNGRIFLAGGPKGVFELIDGQFVCLKDKGHPVGVCASKEGVNFFPAEESEKPWFIRYTPGARREWVKIST